MVPETNELLRIIVQFRYCQLLARFWRYYFHPVSEFEFLDEKSLFFQTKSIWFCPSVSFQHQLLSVAHKIYADLDQNPTPQVRDQFLHISKAFDIMWHKGLLCKIETIWISGDLGFKEYYRMVSPQPGHQVKLEFYKALEFCWSSTRGRGEKSLSSQAFEGVKFIIIVNSSDIFGVWFLTSNFWFWGISYCKCHFEDGGCSLMQHVGGSWRM